MLDAHCGPLQWNFSIFSKVVTLTTPTHAANELLPCMEENMAPYLHVENNIFKIPLTLIPSFGPIGVLI